MEIRVSMKNKLSYEYLQQCEEEEDQKLLGDCRKFKTFKFFLLSKIWYGSSSVKPEMFVS